jgi:hypothetical protein
VTYTSQQQFPCIQCHWDELSTLFSISRLRKDHSIKKIVNHKQSAAFLTKNTVDVIHNQVFLSCTLHNQFSFNKLIDHAVSHVFSIHTICFVVYTI